MTQLFFSPLSKELYKLGARKIGFFGIPPLGCLPSQRTLAGGFNRVCVQEYNQAAQLANTKLSAALNSLSKNLPQSKLVFIDIYNPILDLIVNPQKYGTIHITLLYIHEFLTKNYTIRSPLTCRSRQLVIFSTIDNFRMIW